MASSLDVLISSFTLTREDDARQFESYKAAHSKWVDRARRVLAGTERLAEADVPAPTACAFGRWYAGPGRRYAALPEFGALEMSHARFHQLVRGVAGSVARGDPKAATAALVEAERASNEITRGIDTLARATTRDTTARAVRAA